MTNEPDKSHARSTQDRWKRMESEQAGAAYNAFVALVTAIGRGDTATAEAIAALLVEVVRDRLPIDAKLRRRVEEICS